jgi:hypothetical protein
LLWDSNRTGEQRRLLTKAARAAGARLEIPNGKVQLMSVNMIKQSAESENLSLKPEVNALLVELGVEPISYTGGTLVAKTPITSEVDSQPGTGPRAGYPNVHHAFP